MTKATSFSAGASLTGYLFQCRLALLQALRMVKKHPNGHISIEKFDDIAFEDGDISKCLMQAKHSVSAKSLDDNSVELWKTLRVWMSALDDGLVSLGNTKFMLITTSEAKSTAAATLLRTGASEGDIESAYQLLCDAAKKSESKTTAPARDAFLALTQAEALALLRQVEIIDLHSNLADVTDEIEGELFILSPQHVDQVTEHLEGWRLNVVGKCLVGESLAVIPVQHVAIKASEIGKLFSEMALPITSPGDLGAKDYSKEDEAHIFVKQMRALKVPDSMVERGVRDFYRSFAQRSKWARESLILDDELSMYDARLKDGWERRFEEALLLDKPECDASEITTGRKLFLWASKESQPLRNVIETWITAGSYHGLADRLEVGWHPKFKDIFKQDTDNDA